MQLIVEVVLLLGVIYLVIGLMFYLFLLFSRGLAKIDGNTADTGIGFKLIILPGMMALWPIFMNKWLNRRK